MGIFLEDGKLVTYHRGYYMDAITGDHHDREPKFVGNSKRRLCLPHHDDICFLLPQYGNDECVDVCKKLIRDYATKVQSIAQSNGVECPNDLYADLMERPIQDMPYVLAEALIGVFTLFLMCEPV